MQALIASQIALAALMAAGAFFYVRLLKSHTRYKDSAHEYKRQVKLLSDRIRDLGGPLPDGMLIDSEGNIRRD